MKVRFIALASLLLTLLTACSSLRTSPQSAATKRSDAIRHCYGTYSAAPRLPNRHTDIPKLLAELEDIHANTYHWLIRNSFEWQDLQTFLPQARAKGIKVWVTLVPPSEPPASEPYKLDYIQWGKALGELSVREPNLVAWSIDDFPYNLKLFTPAYVEQMTAAAHATNPNFAFVPCCYYKQIKPAFIAAYGKYFDGILFPYRADSAGGNLKDATLIEAEVGHLRELCGPTMPIILDIYATAHSRLGPSTPEYVRDLLKRGEKACDGVLIYCHQNPQRNSEKYQIIREGFVKVSRK